MDERPIIVISMGDPAGIGPEIAVEAVLGNVITELCRPLIIGELSVLRSAAELKGIDAPILACQSLDDARFAPSTIELLDLGNLMQPVKIGRVDPH